MLHLRNVLPPVTSRFWSGALAFLMGMFIEGGRRDGLAFISSSTLAACRNGGPPGSRLAWLNSPVCDTYSSEILHLKNNIRVDSMWMNLGYDEGQAGGRASNLVEASIALARKLAVAANLSAEDELVIDAGFGWGDQDHLFLTEYHVQKIYGLNITPRNVEVARERMRLWSLSDRADLEVGDATRMTNVANATADKVLALESAFYFQTRIDFFKEAYRVLKEGGRIALLDFLPRNASAALIMKSISDLNPDIAIPAANFYVIEDYVRLMTSIGFRNVHVENLTSKVYLMPGHERKYALLDMLEMDRTEFFGSELYEYEKAFQDTDKAITAGIQILAHSSYFLITADK